MSTSAAQPSSRSRTQARKKVNDDASYFGPPATTVGGSGTKRQATDKPDGESSRVKRKRLEPAHLVSTSNGKRDAVDNEPRKSLVEFHKMPTNMLHRYLTQFDMVPTVYPSPLTPEDPPPPSSLADPQQQYSRPPSPPALTPANRPRRDPKEAHGRRRSSRLLEEETGNRVPILADVADLHNVLASIAERHFRELTSINGREEVDTLAAFMCAVEKSKGGKNKVQLASCESFVFSLDIAWCPKY